MASTLRRLVMTSFTPGTQKKENFYVVTVTRRLRRWSLARSHSHRFLMAQLKSLALLLAVAVLAAAFRLRSLVGDDPTQAPFVRELQPDGSIHRFRYRITAVLKLLPTRINMFLFRASPEAWVLLDSGQAEPANYTQQLISHIKRITAAKGGELKLLFLTHGHQDHSGGAPAILKAFPQVDAVAHEIERPYLLEGKWYGDQEGASALQRFILRYLVGQGAAYNLDIAPSRIFFFSGEEGDVGEAVAGLQPGPRWRPPRGFLTFYRTPGHTRGHVSLVHPASGLLFPADTFLVEGSGRLQPISPKLAPPGVNLNATQAQRDVARLAELPGIVKSYSGHDHTPNGTWFEDVKAFARTIQG